VTLDLEEVERFAIAIMRGGNGTQDRHDLARAQVTRPLAGDDTLGQQVLLPTVQKELAEIIDMTAQRE
jgi:hypothetical protein